jgi:hypothetical protein
MTRRHIGPVTLTVMAASPAAPVSGHDDRLTRHDHPIEGWGVDAFMHWFPQAGTRPSPVRIAARIDVVDETGDMRVAARGSVRARGDRGDGQAVVAIANTTAPSFVVSAWEGPGP